MDAEIPVRAVLVLVVIAFVLGWLFSASKYRVQYPERMCTDGESVYVKMPYVDAIAEYSLDSEGEYHHMSDNTRFNPCDR